MSTLKRCISLLLVLGILLGVLTPAAQAVPVEETATVNTDNVTIEGTNGFGDLLSQEIAESQDEAEAADAEYPGGYTVTDLVIEGNKATVTYDTMEEATLVVALYTEDGMQLVTSANVAVTPDVTTATVTFGSDMPEYFLASAYLLDSYDLSPLCAAYDTPMYTREMQELLASTVNDYDPEKVLNLDEDETTNFAVYADSTIVIEVVEGVNTVASIEDEDATYVIENADEQITSLAEGNVFVYPYAEGEILIVKVAAIEVDGATATITGTELELEEVFSQMKIESSGETADMTVDDSTAAEGISYVGLEEDGIGPQAWEGGGSASASHTFKVNIEKKKETDYVDASFSVTGSLKVSIDVGFNYYIAMKRQFIEFKATPSVNLGVTLTGNVTGKYPIGNFGVSPVAGVYIGFSPEIQLKFDGTVDLSANVSMTIGFGYSSDKGFENLTTKPKVTFNLSVEGKLFFGVDFKPNAKIIHENVASFTIGAAVGFELTAKMSGTLFEYFESDAENKHTCTACLGLDVDFKATLDGELKFLNCDWLTLKVDIAKLTFDLGSWHKSSEAEEFKKGDCPHYVYRLNAAVTADDNTPFMNVNVTAGSEQAVTNGNGIATMYVPKGTYTVTANSGELSASKSVKVEKACKVPIRLAVDGENSGFFGSMIEGSVTDHGASKEIWYNNHRYMLYDLSMNWLEAKSFCENMGGYLVTITSSDENNFIASNITEGVMIGFSDAEEEGVWRWVNGEGAPYTNWARGEPNNQMDEDYALINTTGTWNDGHLQRENWPFICEWDSESIGSYQKAPSLNAIYPGDYGTEVTDTYILKTAAFKDLVPNEQYVLLAMASVEVEDPLTSDNLLFIDQAEAAEDGTLVFQYVQRTPADISYVVACGASNKDLNDAEISFPKMVADGELQVVDPVVVYDGETLIEGRDYVIVGKVDFTEAGEYICYIRGIHNYTGLVECSYTVGQRENPFTDVASDSFYFEPVLWAVENGVTSGTSETTFDPSGLCLRAHVVTFLYRAAGSPAPSSAKNPFTDVKSGDFYYNPVLWAVENGITQGISNTQFGSAQVCNRAAVVTFLWRAFGSPEPESANNPFVDVKNTDFFYKPVLWAVENGITSGVDTTHFNPAGACNRAQVVTFLYRAYN